MEQETKYQVYWRNGKAHLSEDGYKSFCGQRIQHNLGYSRDQDATAEEFINEIRPRCSGCRTGAEVAILVNKFTEQEAE